jgi:hypothetical protein
MTSRLKIYNDALLVCGERSIASLTEARESRRLLDTVWDSGGVDHCLQEAQWKFAMRTQMLDYDTSITPEFGYQRAFQKGSDWLLTSAVCTDEYFNAALLQYNEEAGYIYCDLDQIYVRFVSNDTSYGGDLSLWTSRFSEYVAAHFAARIITTLSSDKERQKSVFSIEQLRMKEAKSLDAMADPEKIRKSGSWVASRRNGTRSDRGSNSQLIG